MKRIAIQTFWTSEYNYGQILQGYALQHFLKEKGYDAYIIRFDCLLSRLKELFSIVLKGKLLQNYRQGRLRHFAEFKQLNIQYSSKYYGTFHKLQVSPPDADYYIVGSDQVWTYMRNEERRNGYLLRFGGSKVKKIAYAASFGRDNLKNTEISTFKDALDAFSFVGVREESGMDICRKIGIESCWVLDPVALLSLSHWTKMTIPIINKALDKKPNVFFYSLTDGTQTPSIYHIMDELAEKYIVYYTNSSQNFDKRMNITPSIEEWISYINQCDFVVTDSFHCTLFCLILQKNFVTIKRHNGEGMSNRLISLLNRLNLNERYTDALPKSVEKMLNMPIEWKNVNEKLRLWRQESEIQLLNALEK